MVTELLENKDSCSYIGFMTKDLKILNNSEVMPVVQLRDKNLLGVVISGISLKSIYTSVEEALYNVEQHPEVTSKVLKEIKNDLKNILENFEVTAKVNKIELPYDVEKQKLKFFVSIEKGKIVFEGGWPSFTNPTVVAKFKPTDIDEASEFIKEHLIEKVTYSSSVDFPDENGLEETFNIDTWLETIIAMSIDAD